jgi:hypothetical protein
MFALALSVLIGGVAVMFIVEGTRLSLRTEASLSNDMVQWGISSRLQLDTKTANGAVIYPGIATSDLKEAERCRGGERGRLLVLSRSDKANNSAKSHFITVTGYLYDASARTLLKFEHTVHSDQQGATPASLETIIISNKDAFTWHVLARDVDSLDPAGPFVCRDIGNINAATATFQLNEGQESLWTSDRVLVEVSFLIRG